MPAQTLATNSNPVYKPDLVRRLLLTFFSGEWQAGDRLGEVDLAQRFGVSRTPVREALQELAAIGLIELKPNCGAAARACGPREVREIYEMREILEGAAAEQACGRIPSHELEELISEFRELQAATRRDPAWSQREWAADRRLHEVIAQACGNGRLAGEIARYGQLIQVIREVVGNQREAQVAAVAEHLAILEALQADKAKQAGAAMRRHIRSASTHAVAALKPRLGASAA